jgi:hypothetical protein
VRKSEGTKPFGRHRNMWEDYKEIDLEKKIEGKVCY